MNAPKDNTLKIVLGVVGCFGCAGVVGLLLLFGAGFAFRGSVPATPPVVTPVPPGPSTSPLAVPTPAAPADWSLYTHSGPCAGSESLRLAHFQVAYPPAHRVLDCHSQTPRPWNYVTFHEQGESEANQIGLGHSRGAVNQEILASVAAQLAQQLGAATPDLVDASPLAARGAALTRRDMAFAVSEARGAFRPGP